MDPVKRLHALQESHERTLRAALRYANQMDRLHKVYLLVGMFKRQRVMDLFNLRRRMRNDAHNSCRALVGVMKEVEAEVVG